MPSVSKRAQYRSFAKWSLLALTIALILMWIASTWLFAGYTCRRFRTGWNAGQFGISVYTDIDLPQWQRPSFWEFGRTSDPFKWGFKYLPPRPGILWSLLQFPAWLLAIPPGAAAFLLYRTDRIRQHRFAHHQCIHCGFDLASSASDICPECGQSQTRSQSASDKSR